MDTESTRMMWNGNKCVRVLSNHYVTQVHLLMINRFEVNYTVTLKSSALVTELSVTNLNG